MPYRRKGTPQTRVPQDPEVHLKRLNPLHYRCDVGDLLFWVDNALPSRAALGKWDISLGPGMTYLTTVKTMRSVYTFIREYVQQQRSAAAAQPEAGES